MITATLRTNGTIRNADGKLIGFYDAADGVLTIDGHVGTFKVTDATHAMEVFGDNYSGAVTHGR